MNPAECNYEIYDKFFNYYQCFRFVEIGIKKNEKPVRVITDYKNL